jgi:hypothetical protein
MECRQSLLALGNSGSKSSILNQFTISRRGNT